jgi:hypothetical protein
LTTILKGGTLNRDFSGYEVLSGMTVEINPVVALNSALGFIKPLPIEDRPLNQCHLLDQSIGDV